MSHNIGDITVSKNSGFCFGVDRACTSLQNAIDANTDNNVDIYTLGKLIHNDTFNSRVKAKGVRVIEEADIDGIIEQGKLSNERSVRIFIRAHGVPEKLTEKLEMLSNKYPFFSYTDCTCPYVKKIQKIAKDASSHSEGENENCFILIGSAAHPEVVSILSYFNGEKFVFSSLAELRDSFDNGRIPFDSKNVIMASQTTMDKNEWDRCAAFAKEYIPNVIIRDTV